MVAEPLVAYRQHASNLSAAAARMKDELAIFEQKHADSRGHGVPIDWGAQHRFVATQLLSAGARRDALKAFARAVRAGDRGSLPRSMGVLLPASAVRWLKMSVLSDDNWLREASRWLDSEDRARSSL